MSHLDDLLASHGVQFSAPPAGQSEDTAAVLVSAAMSALTELGSALELAFKEKDDEDGGSTGQGSDRGDAKKPPFGKKKPPSGKGGSNSKNDDRDDDSDDDDEDDGPPWAKKGKGGSGSKKKMPFGKGKSDGKAKCSALLDAATVALAGLNSERRDWVELTARDNMALSLAGKKPYGNVTYADPGHQKDGKSRYPTDTPEHTRAAWSYVNQKDNSSKYAPEDLASVKSKIKSAMRKHGIKGGDDKES